MKLFKQNPLKFLQEEYGVVAVEAAIILPILFMAIFFFSQIAFVFNNNSQLNIAAAQAARQGTIYSASRPTNANIANIANAYLSNRLVSFAAGTTATCTNGVAGTSATNNAGVCTTVYSCSYTLGSSTLPTIPGTCSTSAACPTVSYSGGNATLITVVVSYVFTGIFKNTSKINPVNLTGTYSVQASEVCE